MLKYEVWLGNPGKVLILVNGVLVTLLLAAPVLIRRHAH
jgi:hypothetical protein